MGHEGVVIGEQDHVLSQADALTKNTGQRLKLVILLTLYV